MIYAFDLDGTLCTKTNGHYEDAQPYSKRIDMVNKLGKLGHHIIIYTSRGVTTKIDWYELTRSQLATWGVCYNELRLDKPEYDVFVDDKAESDVTFFNTISDTYVDHIIDEEHCIQQGR
jgi:hydroxymethylpyrimidine pyrophosphatase-like HAD family hydrolase